MNALNHGIDQSLNIDCWIDQSIGLVVDYPWADGSIHVLLDGP